MAIRRIVKLGDEVLRKKAREVTKFDEKLSILVTDMKETMLAADGVGLAAPQVGILRRVVVIDCGDKHGFVELINPKITKMEGEQKEAEGCLSIPGRRGILSRPTSVVVEAVDRKGTPVSYEGDGIFAIAVCHELDHLDGVLFLDNMLEEIEVEKK